MNLRQVRRKLRRCFRLVRLLARMLMWLRSYARYDGYSELLKEVHTGSCDLATPLGGGGVSCDLINPAHMNYLVFLVRLC